MAVDRDFYTSLYNAFNIRDLKMVLSAMHPDVDWPNGWEGGRVRGHQGVRDYWTRQWQAIDPHVEPVNFRVGERGRTVVTVHQLVRGRDGNLLSDSMVEHSYLTEDGLVKRMDIKKL